MVASLVKKGLTAFVSKQTNIFTAASFIILTTVFSQILGILKYRLLVSLFGASSDLGVFFAAFRIPDFVFQVVVAGALSASFIPIFTEFLANNKKKEAYEFTSALITIGIIFFIFISAIIIVFSYQLSGMIAPGFSKNELRLMANLMIIIQLSQVFFILGTIVTGMLQSFQHFVIPGLANAFYNFGIILGLIIFDLAQTLAMAPVILLGQSIAQASFPALSLKSKDKKEFLSIFTSSFSQILYLTLPVSVILIVLRIPLVRLFYGASRFDWDATVDTGLTLSYLLILKNNLPIYYLAFSFSLSSILGSLVLTFLLNRKIDLPKLNLGISFLKIFISSIVMGVALYIPIKLLDQLVFDTTRTINLLILTGIASVLGLTSYIFFTWLFDIKEAYYVIAVLKKFKHKDKILRQVEEMIEGPKLNP